MNTHDIELPPLPKASKMYDIPGYDEEELKDYARAAVEPYAKRIAELEASRIAYASEFAPDENGNPDVGSIHENIRKLKADRQRRGEPVAWRLHPFDYGIGHEGVYALTSRPDQVAAWERKGWEAQPLYTAPQHAEPIVSDVEAIVRLLESREWAEHVATTPLGQRLETAVTVLVGADQQPSEPVKSHLKVSYDDKGDCLYVVCDSNEPADAEEDDKGILYRRAISDGRLVGITIMNFMGQYAKWSDDVQRPAEPVKVPSDADAKHIQDFIACDGMGAVIVEGPQYSAVVRALLARYGKGTP